MTAPRRYLTAADVAELLRMSVDRFYRRRRKLERAHGFPPPVAAVSNGTFLRYDPEAIGRWQAVQAASAADPAPAAVPPPEPDYAAQAAENARKLAGGAGGD